MLPTPLRTVAPWCGLLLSCVALARADEPDPAQIARQAVTALEQAPRYAWEIRDLEGELKNETRWVGPSSPPPSVDISSELPRPVVRKVKVRTMSPTTRGERRPDGWSVTETVVAKGPKAVAVLPPSGLRVARSEKGAWLTLAQFRVENRRQLMEDPSRLGDRKEQMRYSASWAAFTSPLPHILLPRLIRAAERFRFDRDEIVAEVSADNARQVLGGETHMRQLAPERFKGIVRMRVREGVLHDCRIQLDYDVDRIQVQEPDTVSVDVLILFTALAAEPPAVPEAARTASSGG